MEAPLCEVKGYRWRSLHNAKTELTNQILVIDYIYFCKTGTKIKKIQEKILGKCGVISIRPKKHPPHHSYFVYL